MKNFYVVLCFLLLVCSFNAHEVNAHGVKWEMSQNKAYGFMFGYADDTFMKNATVQVFGPNDAEKLYQEGKTDEKGHYAFIPAVAGEWILKANDGAGHLVTAKLVLKEEDMSKGAQSTQAAGVNLENATANAVKPFKMGLVVSILLNLAFLFLYFKKKK